ARGVVIRREMRQAPKRCSNDEGAARSQEARHFLKRTDGIGQMLQHLGAEHRVKRRIRLAHLRAAGDDIDLGEVPSSGLQASVTLAVIDRIVLRYILQMAAVLLVLAFPGPRIEQTRTSR